GLPKSAALCASPCYSSPATVPSMNACVCVTVCVCVCVCQSVLVSLYVCSYVTVCVWCCVCQSALLPLNMCPCFVVYLSMLLRGLGASSSWFIRGHLKTIPFVLGGAEWRHPCVFV